MSQDPRTGGVGCDGHVHSPSHSCDAGSWSFPTSGSATPMPVIIALATRWADHLR